MDWMAISGYRLPQQLQNNSSSNNTSTNQNNQQVMNDLLNKTNQLTNLSQQNQNNRDNSNTSVNQNSDSATSTMLDMWAASKLEAASNNSNSSSNLGGNGGGHQAPTTPPISAHPPITERSVIGVPGIQAGSVGPGNGNHQTPGGHISASSHERSPHERSGSISTPGSIKGLHFIIIILSIFDREFLFSANISQS